MLGLINRIVLLLWCAAIEIYIVDSKTVIVQILCMLLFAGLGFLFEDKRINGVLIILYGILCIYHMELFIGAPLLTYELVSVIRQVVQKRTMSDITILSGVMLMMIVIFVRNGERMNVTTGLLVAGVTLLAIMLNFYEDRMLYLKRRMIVERDNSQELTLALRQKNRFLLEKQDTDLHVATLKERNRIAREIHDNVGHMLSRAILLTGAMEAMNKEETMKPMIDSLQDTLNGAMTSIRQSVHDLHDESIDLKSAVEQLLEQLSDYKVNYEYDMGSDVPRNIKYCFISIVKEAVTNIIKHSNADKVDVIIMEHPSFYQLQVIDNGKCVRQGDGTGIGLDNMRERVESFEGTLNINSERGYKVFVNIPKKGNENDESSCD